MYVLSKNITNTVSFFLVKYPIFTAEKNIHGCVFIMDWHSLYNSKFDQDHTILTCFIGHFHIK